MKRKRKNYSVDTWHRESGEKEKEKEDEAWERTEQVRQDVFLWGTYM